MALFKSIRVSKNKIDDVPIKEGQYLVCYDSGDIYIDISNIERVLVSAIDIIYCETEEARKLLTPIANKIYIVKSTNTMYIYSDDTWNNITGTINLNKELSITSAELFKATLIKDNLPYSLLTSFNTVRFNEDNMSIPEVLADIFDEYTLNYKKILKTTSNVVSIPTEYNSDDQVLCVFYNGEYLDQSIYTVTYIDKILNIELKDGGLFTKDVLFQVIII